MASEETDEDTVVFGDEFLADEIIARLPARCAVRCTVLSKRFRQLVTSTHFWLRHRRLGKPLELPHAARLVYHELHDGCQFHVVGPTFAIEHAVSMEHSISYASTCNGLVLVYSTGQSSIDGLVFNPATKEEARMSLQLPRPLKESMECELLGFWYGPSSKIYKAVILENDVGCTRLMVVSLDGSGGREPRTVFSSHHRMYSDHNLHTADGKVYFFVYAMNLLFENWDMSVLSFDVDSEAVTRIDIPERQDISTRMLVVCGRPCIYTDQGDDIVLWLLTTNNRLDELYILVKESSPCGD